MKRPFPLILILSIAFLLSALSPSKSVVAQSGTPIYLPLILRGGPTAIPTATSTATPTPPTAPTFVVPTRAATRTPTATDTPIPGSVTIQPNHSYYVSSGGYLYVFGEIQNSTPLNLGYVRVPVDFFNGSGQLVDTTTGYTEWNAVPAGTNSCFSISLTQPAGWTTYAFEKPLYYTSSSLQAFPKLTLLGVTTSINSSGNYVALGQVRNDYGSQVSSVEVEGTLFNSSGQVIDCYSTSPNNSTLDPGQVSAFKITFYSRDSYSGVSTYRLQANGSPQ
jgi:hypothetical protein